MERSSCGIYSIGLSKVIEDGDDVFFEDLQKWPSDIVGGGQRSSGQEKIDRAES